MHVINRRPSYVKLGWHTCDGRRSTDVSLSLSALTYVYNTMRVRQCACASGPSVTADTCVYWLFLSFRKPNLYTAKPLPRILCHGVSSTSVNGGVVSPWRNEITQSLAPSVCVCVCMTAVPWEQSLLCNIMRSSHIRHDERTISHLPHYLRQRRECFVLSWKQCSAWHRRYCVG